jgi:hypothetical protein
MVDEFVSDAGIGARYEDDLAGRHVLREDRFKIEGTGKRREP